MIRTILVTALLSAALSAQAQPALTKPATPLAKPATEAPAASATDATHYWYDGGRRRALRLDETLRADFAAGKAVPAGRMAPGGKALDATEPEAAAGTVVFRDLDSPAVRRALPGGVILTTHAPTDADTLQRRLAPHGLAVSRRLDADGTRWLVETPPGVAGLELANRLHESGDFASAEPNWWRERALK